MSSIKTLLKKKKKGSRLSNSCKEKESGLTLNCYTVCPYPAPTMLLSHTHTYNAAALFVVRLSRVPERVAGPPTNRSSLLIHVHTCVCVCKPL